MSKKKPKEGIPVSALEIGAFKAFTATGDVTGFWVLADACDAGEEGVGKSRTHFAQLLRSVAEAKNPAVHWFYLHGDKSSYPLVETQRQGHLRCAARSAWFEARAFEQCNVGKWRFLWEPDYDIDDEEVVRNPVWQCRMDELVPAPAPGSLPGWRHLQSIGGIDLGADGNPPAHMTGGGLLQVGAEPAPYCRVVMAQLAQETIMEMKSFQHPVPVWLAVETPATVEVGIPRWADLGRGMFHHPIVQDKLVVILPCVPAGELLWDDTPDARKACRAYFMHEGKVQETFYRHDQFMLHTTRWNAVMNAEPWAELRRALVERNIHIDVKENAPPHYLRTHQERRKKMRDDDIPF